MTPHGRTFPQWIGRIAATFNPASAIRGRGGEFSGRKNSEVVGASRPNRLAKAKRLCSAGLPSVLNGSCTIWLRHVSQAIVAAHGRHRASRLTGPENSVFAVGSNPQPPGVEDGEVVQASAEIWAQPLCQKTRAATSRGCRRSNSMGRPHRSRRTRSGLVGSQCKERTGYLTAPVQLLPQPAVQARQ